MEVKSGYKAKSGSDSGVAKKFHFEDGVIKANFRKDGDNKIISVNFRSLYFPNPATRAKVMEIIRDLKVPENTKKQVATMRG